MASAAVVASARIYATRISGSRQQGVCLAAPSKARDATGTELRVVAGTLPGACKGLALASSLR